ncbi:MAG: hypothetical protein KJO07_12110 [Deltaproteobacteria bacterium]|nr:hypothetical protein [Deltaproteobacteria bacterium]
MPGRCSHLALAAALALGCGSSSSKKLPPLSKEELAARHFQSAGSELLAHAPLGAQLVVEVDFARIRENPVLGELTGAVAGIWADTGLGFDPLRDADVMVLCAYRLGTAKAETLTLVSSDKLANLAGAESLADGVVAVGSVDMRKQARAVVAGKGKSMTSDARFMKIRDGAVPDKAPGATLRFTAVLDFESRVSMARLFDLDRVPTAISAWGDVADDLAVVGILGADDAREAKKLAQASRKRLRKMAGHPILQRLVLGYLLESVSVTAHKHSARLVLVIEPNRLELLSKRLTRYAREASQNKAAPAPPVEEPES